MTYLKHLGKLARMCIKAEILYTFHQVARTVSS